MKGKFEHSDRGDQIIAYEVEVLELSEKDMAKGPMRLDIHITSADFNQTTSIQLNRILQRYPGKDAVVLFLSQSDGRKFRAQLPVSVDAGNNLLLSEIQNLFGRKVWGEAV